MNKYYDETVLVVDDTETNIDILVDTLSDICDVSVAMDGETALQLVEEEPPALILLDIMMPGMDGYEVCQRLKAEPKTKDIPVLFVSAMDETVDKVKGFDVGALDYITKPFDPDEVRARVRTHLELRRLQQENVDARIAAEQAKEAKDRFMATVSHGLRTPLNAVLGVADLLLSEHCGPLTDKQTAYLKQQEQSGGQLLGLINDLIDIAQMDAGKMQLHLKSFSLKQLLVKIIKLAQPAFAQKQLTISGSIPDTPCDVYADKAKLEQALLHLLLVTIERANPETAVTINVEERSGKEINISISSNGVFIPEEELHELFTDAHVVDSESEEENTISPLDLRLPCARRLIEIQGGAIGADLKEENICCLWFTVKTPKGDM